jgi:methyl-accepting chemotaxis protein
MFDIKRYWEKIMPWFQNSKENNDLADKLYELLSSSNSTLKNVHESFEKLWKEINDSKLEMAKFSTEVNGELNAINKSIDSLSKSVTDTERSMFGIWIVTGKHS